MTPFRKRPIKWNKDTDSNKLPEKNGFVYDIINQKALDKDEEMPKFFIADSEKEALAIYEKFEPLLNGLAYIYSVSTGIPKEDIFSEGLIGLGRAYRDWDPTRSDVYKNYAIIIVKDSIFEYVRKNASAIVVPSYIKKANYNLLNLKDLCKLYNVDWYDAIFDDGIVAENMPEKDIIKCGAFISNIKNAAKRARVKLDKFVQRIEDVPRDVTFEDFVPEEIHNRNVEMLEASLIVEKLKVHMSAEELIICDSIMDDKSYDEIAIEMGKSKSWVSGKVSTLREKILTKMKERTL